MITPTEHSTGKRTTRKISTPLKGKFNYYVNKSGWLKRKNSDKSTTDAVLDRPLEGIVSNISGITEDNTVIEAVNILSNAIDVGGIIKVTYAELKVLRDASELTPGQQYQITDYEFTTIQTDTQSAGNVFDIIVTADEVDTLNENARAVQHAGDTYFDNANLAAWKLKYSIDNDDAKFAWADTVTGKGVIWQMVDEWNNECPYDFKNAQFQRPLTDGVYDDVLGVDTWCYTFTWVNETDGIEDLSIIGNTLMNYEDLIEGVFNNVIKATTGYNSDIGEGMYVLNSNVFINSYYYNGDVIFYGCYGNRINANSWNNTFNDSAKSNIIGTHFRDNKFSHNCVFNKIGNNYSFNKIGNDFINNEVGNSFKNIIIGNYCKHNTFGNNISDKIITFGNNVIMCSFQDYCFNGLAADLDLSAATHLSATYNKTIYYDKTLGTRLSYLDNDVIQRVVVTA